MLRQKETVTKDSEKSFGPLLTGLGFSSESHQTWTLWRFAAKNAATPRESGKNRKVAKSSSRLANPWRVGELEVSERRTGLALHKLTVSLDKQLLLQNLTAATKKYFGPRASADFVFGAGGDVWCVFEFSRPGSREKATVPAQTAAGALMPHGIGGFNFRLIASGMQCEVLVSDFFGFGFLPPTFASVPLRLIADALYVRLGDKDQEAELLKSPSINELRFPLATLAVRPVFANEAAADELLQQLIRAKAQLTPTVLTDGQGLQLVTPSDELEIQPGVQEVTHVPLEVLEAREREAKLREVDSMILSGKLGRAAEVVSNRLGEDPSSVYLMRRLALLGITGMKERAQNFVQQALRLEPDNKLFLSLAIGLGLEQGDQSAVLQSLSRLGSLLMEQIPGADGLSTFDVVLPELLGDAWCVEDRRKAEECYQRIIQRRGDMPRILRKLISISKLGARPETEVSYLSRLASVERRRVELAKINFRLAELRRQHPTGRDEAVNLALKSLKLDRAHYDSALLAAELLVEKERAEEAVQLLDGLLKDKSINLAMRARARLETAIGRIWHKHLGRPDLAETRYEQALELDVSNLDALKDLETIYRSSQRPEGLAKLLEAEFNVFERLGNSEAMRNAFDELVTLYRGVLAQPKRAFELYQRLLGSTSIEPQEIDRVLSWRDVEIDWHDLYGKLNAKLPSIPAGQKRAHFLCRLAEICRDKLKDPRGALGHLRAALDEGFVDEAGFQFLVEALTAEQDYVALARCYETRIEQAAKPEQRRLMIELLALPNVLSDPKRDHLAVQAYCLDTASEKVLQQRFRFYQSLDDIDGVERLLQVVTDEKELSAFQKAQWTRFAIEVLEACVDDQRFVVIDGLYRKLLDQAEDKVPVYQDAISSLKECQDQKRLQFYVAELLAAGLLPPLDERVAVKLLQGLDHELALYHQLMSLKSTQAEIAAVHARTAAALYAKRANQEANTEKMLTRLASLVPCAEADLTQLRQLVEKSGNWSQLAKALQRQADFEDEKQRKYALLEQLGVVYWKKLKDLGRARLTFVLAMKVAKEPTKLKLVLANIAFEAGDQAQERKALIDFVNDPAVVNDVKSLNKAVERLLRLGEESGAVQRLVSNHIEQATASGNAELAGALSNVLLDHNIATSELYKTSFKAAIAQQRDDRAVDLWWRGLACVSNKSKAKAYLSETSQILEREDRKDLLVDCYKAALENNVGDRLGPKIHHEILLQYGALLFDIDAKRRKALAVYRQAYDADPEDNRTWMPLYFLLLEFGTPEQRLMHLRDVVRKLINDPRPLKAFPITIESLGVELEELEQQVGDKVAPGVDLNLEDGSAEPAEAVEPGQGEEPAVSMDVAPETPELAMAAPEAPSEVQEMPVPMAQVAGEAVGFSLEPEAPAAEPEGDLGFRPDLKLVPEPTEGLSSPELPDLPSPGHFSTSNSEESAVLDLGLEAAQGLPPLEGSQAGESPEGFAPDMLGLSQAPVEEAAPAVEPQAVDEAAPVESVQVEEPYLGTMNFDGAGGGLSLALEGAAVSKEPVAEAAPELSVVDAAATKLEGLASEDYQLPEPPQASAESLASDGDVPPLEASVIPDLPRTSQLHTQNSVIDSPGWEHSGIGTSSGSPGNFGINVEPQDDVGDWRAAVIKGDFNADFTARLLKQAFASELEKHLAIQSVALVAGNCDRLNNWHWRVWRKADEFGYPLSGKDRFPSGTSPQILHSALHKFVVSSAPLLVRVFRERFTLDYVAKRLEMNVSAVERLRKPMSWSEGLLRDVGFGLYADRIAQRRYQAFNIQGLGKEIFYEGGSRSLYLDESYYRKAPPSHLFHRILGILWSVRIHYFVPLALDARRQFMPFLSDVHQHFGAQGLSKIKTRLKGRSATAKHISTMDTRQLRQLHEKIGMPTEDQVVQLWEAMRAHIFKLLIAETLDVIGVFEHMVERDLLKKDVLKHSQIYEMSPFAKSLIEFVTKLKI